MIRKLTAAALLLAMLLCGCGEGGETSAVLPSPEPAPAITPAITPTPEAAPSPTPSPTPAPEPTPTPLAAESGKSLLRYDCEETGDHLDYWLIMPEKPVEGMPILIYLHGDGNVGRPESLENNALAQRIDEIYGGDFPFIVLMPCTRSYSWTEGTIPQTMISLAKYTAEAYNADAGRIMIAGHSRGAIGLWYIISTYPELFSAAAPISCGCDKALDYTAMANVPVWGFAGDLGQDGTHYLPAMQRIAGNINSAGGSARIDVLTGCGHAEAEKAAFSEALFDWLLSQ